MARKVLNELCRGAEWGHGNNTLKHTRLTSTEVFKGELNNLLVEKLQKPYNLNYILTSVLCTVNIQKVLKYILYDDMFEMSCYI